MLSLLPSNEHLLPFLLAAIALTLTPGSDMTFVALAGARGGRTAGIAAAGGIFAGCLGHILCAAIGLSALIVASQAAFATVKWVGVAYLLYLAVQLLRQGGAAGKSNHDTNFRPAFAFRRAALVNLLNPKVGIFFLAFLPQFIEPEAGAPWRQILLLGIIFNLLGLVVNVLVGLFAAATSRRLGGSRRLARASRCFAATVMGALAIKLAVTQSD
jgi:threonine/homoserine/homoserine lactone efflux protein